MDYCDWVEKQRSETPRLTNWEDIPAEEIRDPQVSTHTGTVRKSWVGNNLMLTRVVVGPHSVGKIHMHAAEQVSIILRGRVKVTMSGESFIATAGSIVHTPGNTAHMFEILDEETEMLDAYNIVSSAEELRKQYP